MEKKIVRSWEDLENIKGIAIIKPCAEGTGRFVSLGTDSFCTNKLENAIKYLNAFGFDFEHEPVEIIDTFPKFREFLVKNNLRYSPSFNFIFQIGIADKKLFTLETLEEEFNVDLQILKK